MKWFTAIVGLVAAAFLMALLALTRLWVSNVEVADLDVREIELAPPEEPPPPPPEEEPPDVPPPPALTEVAEVPDPTRVPVPKAEVPMNLELPVDPFFTDLEPAPLPEPVVRKAPPRASAKPASRPAAVRPPPAPVAKSHYSISELDGKPRLLRHGSAVFPSSLARKGVTSGTVTFEVELSTSGSVSIRRVVSSSHPELVSPARRVAASARFTAPTRDGQRVKAVMRWPITIRK